MARTKTQPIQPITPTAAEIEAANDEAARAVVRADAARELSASERQANMMALAGQIGYTLPEGISFDAVAADVRLHLQLHEQHQQAADESLFRVGIGLMVLREGCARGEFAALCESFGFSRQHGYKLIELTSRFTDCNSVTKNCQTGLTLSRLTEAAGNLRKLAELTAFSDEELAELEETGEVLGVTLDDISRASARKLRDILKRAREREQAANDTAERLRDQLDRANREIEAQHRLLGEKSLEIEKLKRRETGLSEADAIAEEKTRAVVDAARSARLAIARLNFALREAQTAVSKTHGDETPIFAACLQMLSNDLDVMRAEAALPILPECDDRLIALQLSSELTGGMDAIRNPAGDDADVMDGDDE